MNEFKLKCFGYLFVIIRLMVLSKCFSDIDVAFFFVVIKVVLL